MNHNLQFNDDVSQDALVSYGKGVLLNGVFVPLDIDEIDAEAEADVAAGRVHSLEDVMRDMRVLIARWEREKSHG